MSTTDWTIQGFLDVRDGVLHIDGVSAVDLAREHETPLFVFSERRIRQNIGRLKDVQNVIDTPLKICYAAKAMSTMGILRAIREAGIDIEVNSGGELWKALRAGFTGDQIIFNGTSKEVWELEMAIEAGIYAIQVDSLYELSLIQETASNLNKRANVSLRLVPEIESDTHSGLQTALVTSKFGMMPDEAFTAFAEYKDSPHLNLAGIHLHIGSQNPAPDVYTEALEMLFASMLRIYRESGVKLQHVNLGGGFPVDYSRGMEAPLPEVRSRYEEWAETGQQVHKLPTGGVSYTDTPQQIKETVSRLKMFEADYPPDSAIGKAWNEVLTIARRESAEEILTGTTLLLEPGRSIIADAGICLTSVRNHKERPLADIRRDMAATANRQQQEEKQARQDRDNGEPARAGSGAGGTGFRATFWSMIQQGITADHWLLTDAGFNILLSMETYKWYYHLISASRAGESHDFPYKLAGPLCDGGDVYFDNEGGQRLPSHRMLPQGVAAGEVLALLNCGAYSLAQASQYNGRFLPAVVLITENGNAELIRRRDTFDDLVNNDQ